MIELPALTPALKLDRPAVDVDMSDVNVPVVAVSPCVAGCVTVPTAKPKEKVVMPTRASNDPRYKS